MAASRMGAGHAARWLVGVCLALASCSDAPTTHSGDAGGGEGGDASEQASAGKAGSAHSGGNAQAGNTTAGTQNGLAGEPPMGQAGHESAMGGEAGAPMQTGSGGMVEAGAGGEGGAGGAGGEGGVSGEEGEAGSFSSAGTLSSAGTSSTAGSSNTAGSGGAGGGSAGTGTGGAGTAGTGMGGVGTAGTGGSSNHPGGPVIFVRAGAAEPGNGDSWATAFPRLEAALAVAVAGQQIWVAEGTYRPGPAGSDHWPSYFLKTGVELYGGFDGVSDDALEDRDPDARVTILDGDMNANDDSLPTGYYDDAYIIVTASDVGPTAVLDGFTVQNGGPGNYYSNIEIYDDPPTLRNLRVRHSHTVFGGGVGYSGVGQHAASFENLTFEANDSWGMAMYGMIDFTCRNCTFFDNGQAVTIGGDFDGPVTAKFIDSTFEDSGFGAWNTEVNVRGPADVTLLRCRFSLSLEMSLLILDGGTVRFIESVATGFMSASIYPSPILQISADVNDERPVADTRLDVVNSTFYDNGRPEDEFFMVWGGGGNIDLHVYNSVIDNPGSEIEFYEMTGFSIDTGNSFFPGQAGPGNVTQPPLLDADGRPTAGSSLIDAGSLAVPDGLLLDSQDLDHDGNVAEVLPFDLDGNPRIVDYPPLNGAKIDIGAFEAAP